MLGVHDLLETCRNHGAIFKGTTSIADWGSGSGLFLMHALHFSEGKGVGIEMSKDRVNNALSLLRTLIIAVLRYVPSFSPPLS